MLLFVLSVFVVMLSGVSDVGAHEEPTLLYYNPLATEADLEGFVMEGPGVHSFENGRLRLWSSGNSSDSQNNNFVLWCPFNVSRSPDLMIEWEFMPFHDEGLAMLFFGARSLDGLKDIMDPSLAPRNGRTEAYRDGDINANQISYYRRSKPSERRLQVVNLRPMQGKNTTHQVGDPLPAARYAQGPYKMTTTYTKAYGRVTISLTVDTLDVFTWKGTPLVQWGTKGKIGIRILAPLIAEFAHLRITRL